MSDYQNSKSSFMVQMVCLKQLKSFILVSYLRKVIKIQKVPQPWRRCSTKNRMKSFTIRVYSSMWQHSLLKLFHYSIYSAPCIIQRPCIILHNLIVVRENIYDFRKKVWKIVSFQGQKVRDSQGIFFWEKCINPVILRIQNNWNYMH